MVDMSSYSEEAKLHEFLSEGYNKHIRPRNKQTQITNIRVVFSLTSVTGVDEVKGIISTVCALFVYWRDDNLKWKPSMYGNITEITIDKNLIWSPGFTISNSATRMERLGESISSTQVYWRGTVRLEFGHVIKTTCDITVTYFPFDSQYCDVRLFSIGVSSKYINLSISQIDTSVYMENNEWILKSTSAQIVYLGSTTYAKYTIILERRYTFYILNLFFPVLILAFLNAMVFVLPADSGERVGYAITCLLSLSVYMTFASESLPNSSKPLPIITLILLAYIIISALISVGTVVGLMLHLHDNSKPPSGCLVKLLCLWNKTKSIKSRVAGSEDVVTTDIVYCSWKDVAKVFDRLCFVASNICIILITSVYFVIVQIGIQS